MPAIAPPAFVVLHASPRLSLAAEQLLLPPEQAPALANALALAQALAQLHEEEAARVQAAVASGHATGRAEGQALGHALGVQQAAAALAHTAQQLDARAAAEAAALGQQVVALALLVVRRIAAELAPEAVLASLARKAVEHLATDAATGEKHGQLRLHPALLPAVQRLLADEQPGLRVIADESLAPLDCVLDTPGGRLLAGLETQLARVQASLSRAPAESRTESRRDSRSDSRTVAPAAAAVTTAVTTASTTASTTIGPP
jgi:flagellar biosynthesis/type III secretory pathway protein FliH